MNSPDAFGAATPSCTSTQAGGHLLRLSQVVSLTSVLLILYAPVLANLVRQWGEDPNYSHGFMVPIFAGYVVWKRRYELAATPASPAWSGLFVVLGSLGVLFVGSLGAELFLARSSFIGMLAGGVLYFYGWRKFRLLAFPLLVLLLMVPLPALIYNQIVFPLQLLASKLAASFLQQTQIVPVLREGNVLVLPGLRLEVVEACSGIRSLISLITLAVIYGYAVESRTWIRATLIFLMLPVAVLANSARVLFTAAMSQVWGAAAAEGWRHELSGIVLFAFATMALFLSHAVIKRLATYGSR